MTATAWLFLAVVASIVAAGVVMEWWQRRLDERERQRYERSANRQILRELRRYDELGRIEPTEPRRRP